MRNPLPTTTAPELVPGPAGGTTGRSPLDSANPAKRNAQNMLSPAALSQAITQRSGAIGPQTFCPARSPADLVGAPSPRRGCFGCCPDAVHQCNTLQGCSVPERWSAQQTREGNCADFWAVGSAPVLQQSQGPARAAAAWMRCWKTCPSRTHSCLSEPTRRTRTLTNFKVTGMKG